LAQINEQNKLIKQMLFDFKTGNYSDYYTEQKNFQLLEDVAYTKLIIQIEIINLNYLL